MRSSGSSSSRTSQGCSSAAPSQPRSGSPRPSACWTPASSTAASSRSCAGRGRCGAAGRRCHDRRHGGSGMTVARLRLAPGGGNHVSPMSPLLRSCGNFQVPPHPLSHRGRGCPVSSTLHYSGASPRAGRPVRRDVRVGDGVWLTDSEGRRYLDLLGGIAVVSLGHCHPAPLAARATPARPPLAHLQPLLDRADAAAAGGRLSDRFGGARAFFCNSGTEAVEAA